MPGILDRYILRMFLSVLAITFFSLTGLYIVIDVFANFDEFASQGESGGGTFAVLADYYGPRVLQFFDRMGPVIMLLSAILAITWMLQRNELTAIMAGGVSKGRVLQPLIYAAMGVSMVSVVNREFCIPAVRHKLTRNAKDFHGTAAKTLRPTYDYRTDVYIGGRQTVARERKILNAHFRLPASLSDFGTQIAAESAIYKERSLNHPAGYMLEHVTTPENLRERPSVPANGTPVVISPRDAEWLLPHQCFVVSDVSFEQLSGGSYWRQLGSTRELATHLRNPSLELGSDARVLLHARLVQPLLDLTLFVLGLPLVLAKHGQNLFVASSVSLGLITVFFIVVICCHALGSNYLLSPALSAWLPLMIFSPAAYATAAPMWR